MNQRSFQMTLDATGAGTVDIPQTNTAMYWHVRQISIRTFTQAPSSATLYHSGRYLTHTVNGNADTADGVPTTMLMPSDTLSVTWMGATPNDKAYVTVWYDEYPNI